MAEDLQEMTWDELSREWAKRRIAELEAELSMLRLGFHRQADTVTKTNHQGNPTTSCIEWHCPECEAKDKRIATLESSNGWPEVKRAADENFVLLTKIASLEAALRAIAEHPHCDHEATPWGTLAVQQEDKAFRLGHANGHRCAAEIARKVLKKNDQTDQD